MLMMAADYPFMDVLWSMIIFFFWVIWVWIVITVLIDIFRRHDIGGFAKALWVIFVVILPWLGVLIYLIAEHDEMRSAASSRRRHRGESSTSMCATRRAAGPLGRSRRPRSCSTPARSAKRSSTRLKPKRSHKSLRWTASPRTTRCHFRQLALLDPRRRGASLSDSHRQLDRGPG